MSAGILLYVVAAWLIAAHFLRDGSLVLTVLCLLTPLLFFLHRHWSLLVLQCLAYAAAVVWLWTAWHIVAERRFFGQVDQQTAQSQGSTTAEPAQPGHRSAPGRRPLFGS